MKNVVPIYSYSYALRVLSRDGRGDIKPQVFLRLGNSVLFVFFSLWVAGGVLIAAPGGKGGSKKKRVEGKRDRKTEKRGGTGQQVFGGALRLCAGGREYGGPAVAAWRYVRVRSTRTGDGYKRGGRTDAVRLFFRLRLTSTCHSPHALTIFHVHVRVRLRGPPGNAPPESRPIHPPEGTSRLFLPIQTVSTKYYSLQIASASASYTTFHLHLSGRYMYDVPIPIIPACASTEYEYEFPPAGRRPPNPNSPRPCQPIHSTFHANSRPFRFPTHTLSLSESQCEHPRRTHPTDTPTGSMQEHKPQHFQTPAWSRIYTAYSACAKYKYAY